MTNASVQTRSLEDSAWRAHLHLGFEQRGARSVCHERRHSGPLRVQRPFYPEGEEVCHVYVLHPPGGVVGGDELNINVEVNGAAAALLTTPAAGKFYRSEGRQAKHQLNLQVASAASLEWFPQETIFFDGVASEMMTQVELQGDAHFMGWEILCLGRPGAGESFSSGTVSQTWDIRRDGKPIFIEHALYDGNDAAVNASWGLASQPVCGSMVCVGDDADSIEKIHDAIAALKIEGLFGVTRLAKAMVCRYLGPHGDEARDCFMRAWEILRPASLGRKACEPRIWAT